MKKILTIAILSLSMLGLVACSTGATQEIPTFKIGSIPDSNVSELQENMDKMAVYLSEELGLNVEFVASNDYAALVTAFERGEIQLAWFGGLTGVQARAAVAESEAIAQRPEDPDFKSVFIAQKSLGLTSLEDAKGKTLVFGSESSTSGNLMPRYFLQEAGINPETDFNGLPNYSGSHDKTIKLVESGAYQVGALNKVVWDKFVAENNVDLDLVDVFYTTPGYYDYNWTINKDEYVDDLYGMGTKDDVISALLTMHESDTDEAKSVLKYYSADRFIGNNNNNYMALEKIARELGMVK